MRHHFIKDKVFYQSLIAITLPIALQNIISYSVNLMDTLMLGKLGEVALSATSLANQVFFLFTLLIFGIGGGALVISSQNYGPKNFTNIQIILSMTLKITFIVSLLFTSGLLLFPTSIMKLFSHDPVIIATGASYLRIIAPSYLFYGLTSILLVVLRSVETVNICLITYIISFITNVVFNYLFSLISKILTQIQKY